MRGAATLLLLATVVPQIALAQSATLEATPSGTAPAGSTITIRWSGPNGPGDYITVVRKDSALNAYLDYKPTSTGRTPVNPVSLVLPAEPGAYEIRYVIGSPRRVLATVPYEVTAIAATVEGPASIAPDARFEVAWLGPNNGGDFVTVVAAGAGPRAYGSYVDARNGQADARTGRRVATLRAPAKPGQYELRYVQRGTVVIGTRAIEVTATTSAGSSPAPQPTLSAVVPVLTIPAAQTPTPQTPQAPAPTVSTETTRAFPSTTGKVLTQSIGSADRWSGWVSCQVATTQGTYTEGAYTDQHTQTWTIGGAPSVEGGVTIYPATWTVSGSGGSSRGVAATAGSFPGGDYEHTWWELNTTGIAAPLAFAVRASDDRLTIGSAHPPLQSNVVIERIIGDANGIQVSPTSRGSMTGTLREVLLPAIEGAATSTSLTGMASPSATYPVSPNQPAGTRTTVSCSWSFAKGMLSAAPLPVRPPMKTRPVWTSGALESLKANQPIRVLVPNGSEDWAVNTTRSIEWTHTLGAGQRFDIDLSVDGGTTWLALGRNVPDDGSGSRGSFAAALPGVGSTAGLVRVSPAGNASAGDVSDGGFKLGPAWLRMLTPVSVSVQRGGRYAMQVDTNLGVNERYTIAVAYDSQHWETISTTGYSGMSLTVPGTAPVSGNGPGGMIRVTSNTVPTLSATGYLRITF